jgi:hypothetical protein
LKLGAAWTCRPPGLTVRIDRENPKSHPAARHLHFEDIAGSPAEQRPTHGRGDREPAMRRIRFDGAHEFVLRLSPTIDVSEFDARADPDRAVAGRFMHDPCRGHRCLQRCDPALEQILIL